MIVGWDPMGYVSQTIQDLNIPRNSQDTFILPLDWTLRHHDSAQLVIKYSPAQPITSPTFYQTLIRLCSPRVSCTSSSTLSSSSFDPDHVSSWLLIVPFPSLLITHTLFFFFLSHYCSGLSHSSHSIVSPDSAFSRSLVISLCTSLVLCLEHW